MPDLITRAYGGGRIGALWCSLMHGSPMWPIHGHYQCRICARQFPVPWAEREYVRHQARQGPLPSFGSFLPKLLILAFVIARPIQAADNLIENPCPAAAIALERYIRSQGEVGQWPLETIQIDASLPKLAKNGRLRAMRRLLPFGHPQYQVLESTGDSMVKQQVIVRYLSADAKTTELPAPSVAIIPANYRFRYLIRQKKSWVNSGSGSLPSE